MAVNCIGHLPLVSGPQFKLIRPILINLVALKVELVGAQINRAEHPSTECDQIWVIWLYPKLQPRSNLCSTHRYQPNQISQNIKCDTIFADKICILNFKNTQEDKKKIFHNGA